MLGAKVEREVDGQIYEICMKMLLLFTCRKRCQKKVYVLMIGFDCKLARIVVYDIILFIPADISLNSVSFYTLCSTNQSSYDLQMVRLIYFLGQFYTYDMLDKTHILFINANESNSVCECSNKRFEDVLENVSVRKRFSNKMQMKYLFLNLTFFEYTVNVVKVKSYAIQRLMGLKKKRKHILYTFSIVIYKLPLVSLFALRGNAYMKHIPLIEFSFQNNL